MPSSCVYDDRSKDDLEADRCHLLEEEAEQGLAVGHCAAIAQLDIVVIDDVRLYICFVLFVKVPLPCRVS